MDPLIHEDMSLFRNAAAPLFNEDLLEGTSFAIQANESGLVLILLYDGGGQRVIGRLSGGIEWTIGNALVNALADGRVEMVSYDAHAGKVWERVSQARLSDVAEEIEHNPGVDVDRVVEAMINAMERRENIVKIGLRISRERDK